LENVSYYFPEPFEEKKLNSFATEEECPTGERGKTAIVRELCVRGKEKRVCFSFARGQKGKGKAQVRVLVRKGRKRGRGRGDGRRDERTILAKKKKKGSVVSRRRKRGRRRE